MIVVLTPEVIVVLATEVIVVLTRDDSSTDQR